MVYLTRKAEFSASHYYHNPELSPEENRRVFGKCNNPNGHGHNYTLEVTVKGKVDPRSGFVVDLKQLKEVMHREVLDAMDTASLTKKVPRLPTAFRPPKTSRLRSGSDLSPNLKGLNCTAFASTRPLICSSISTEKHEIEGESKI